MNYCTRCQRPLQNGDKFCEHCGTPVAVAPASMDAPPKRKTGLIIGIIAALLVLALGLSWGLGLFDLWDSGSHISAGKTDRDDDDDDDDRQTEPAAVPQETTGGLWGDKEDKDETKAPETGKEQPQEKETIPGMQATEPVKPAPVFLNELGIAAKNGKVWTRHKDDTDYYAHSRQDAPSCWDDLDTPGHTAGTVADNMGNIYTYGIHVDGSESKTYSVSFALDGKYTLLTGTCACPSRDGAISSYIYNGYTAYGKYFEIYGDGRLLYTSASMWYGGAPEYFEIDVTGVNLLTVQYPASDGPNEIATLYDGKVS